MPQSRVHLRKGKHFSKLEYLQGNTWVLPGTMAFGIQSPSPAQAKAKNHAILVEETSAPPPLATPTARRLAARYFNGRFTLRTQVSCVACKPLV